MTRAWGFASLLLTVLVACGGGSGGSDSSAPPAAHATQISYQDPPASYPWRFVRNPSSTSKRLVLDLIAPQGAKGRGVTLTLGPLPYDLAWSTFPDGRFIQNHAYQGNLALRSRAQLQNLTVLDAQTPGTPVLYGSAPVLSVAMSITPSAVPQTISVSGAQCGHLNDTGAIQTFSPAFGAIQLK